MEVNDAKPLRLRGLSRLGSRLKDVGRKVFRRPSRTTGGGFRGSSAADGISNVKPSTRRRILKGLGGILGTTLLGVGLDQAINGGSQDEPEEYEYYG